MAPGSRDLLTNDRYEVYTSTTEFNCGIDLHARQMCICVMDRSGKKLVHTNIRNNDFEYFLKLVAPYRHDLTSPDGVLVSVPERALLEMLSEVGVSQGVEEARNIMEGARSLRPEVLTTLVKNCRRVKVVRLCVSWAEELNLPWAAAAKKAAGKPLSNGRWMTRLKDGTMLVLKP